MTRPRLLWAHEHISEREPDGTWEDCTFTAGLMHARVARNYRLPATHNEMQALRAAAGLGVHGGANIDDLQRGYARRYNWFGGTELRGFTNLWNALRLGRSATVQGSMGAFRWGHSLRRHDPGFAGAHAVYVARVDATDRVWWDDPLAPEGGGYEGQWVSKSDLKLFVDRLFAAGGRHLVSPILAPPTIPPPDTSTGEIMRTFYIDKNTRAGWWTVVGKDHKYLRLKTNTLHDIAAGTHKRAIGPVTLANGGITGPGDPRRNGYVIETEAAFMISADGQFIPDAVEFKSAEPSPGGR